MGHQCHCSAYRRIRVPTKSLEVRSGTRDKVTATCCLPGEVRAIRRRWLNARKRCCRTPRGGDSASNGAAENAVRDVEGIRRPWKYFMETKPGIRMDNKHVLMPWDIQHARTIITRHQVGTDGPTACHRLEGKAPSGKMLPWIETVLYTKPKDASKRQNKLEPKHFFGIFAGIVPRSSEIVVLTEDGAVLVRTIHRLP